MLKFKLINTFTPISINHRYWSKNRLGFTLIELMIVVVVISILAAILLPSYHEYIRKNAAAQAEQEMLKIAEHLERHKSKNFTYRNFDINSIYGSSGLTNIVVPFGATGDKVKYTLSLVGKNISDTDVTLSEIGVKDWAITAITSDSKNYNYLMTSKGIKCKTFDAVTTARCTGTQVLGW